MKVSSADENLGGEDSDPFFSAAITEADMEIRQVIATAGK
jgi:hypothetical protein